MTRKLKYILPALLLFATACKKQLDINTDPNNPASLEVSKLLPRVEKELGHSLATGEGLSQILGVYTHQLTSREDPDQYGATGNDFNIQTSWIAMYGSVLNNTDEIIKQSTESGNAYYAGIGKVIKAYAFSQYVDAFGDVPFSEFNKLLEGNSNPKFDKGMDIYPALFELLDAAITDFATTPASNVLKPGSDDVIYGGNITKWRKAAKTIKLKLLVQQRLVKDVSAEVNALISENDLISTTNESFLLPYGPNGATDDRNPGFADYYASQRGQYISPWFYEILQGLNPSIYAGITDPRVPYYFFNQLKPTQAPESDQPTEYRDGGFISIYFGSVGPDRDRTQQNNMTLIGMYPVGGRYDDGGGKASGTGGKITATEATGAAPYRFVTYADRLYLEAELMKVGLVAGDAKAKLEAAIKESFKQIDYVITTYVKPAQTVPAIATTNAATEYVTEILAQYDSKPSQQLESIMTQKWISSFGSAVDQYTDYRRTGFPVLFNPKNPAMAPGGLVTPPTGIPVPVQLNRNYPLTLPWYTNELEVNTSAPDQKDPATFKPFWLP